MAKDVAIAYIVCGVVQDHWKVKNGGYISCPKDASMAVDGEVGSSGIALTRGCHGLVEVDHYPWIEESVRSHKWL